MLLLRMESRGLRGVTELGFELTVYSRFQEIGTESVTSVIHV